MYYTLGQRQGLHIGGTANGQGEPWYVVGKDIVNNRLIVAQGHDHPHLFSHGLVAEQLSWIATPPRELPYHCHAKTRYRQADQACYIEAFTENGCKLRFQQPQRAVTPGQSVVFYQGECCLGGAIISSTF
jgi:tRNA-specific 2-thiouridylase